MTFHSFGYPDETGRKVLETGFWQVKMVNGIITFPRPEEIPAEHRRVLRPMSAKKFVPAQNFAAVETGVKQ
jgi:CRISPR-associated protein Cas5d